jgi:predicted nucleic acid-binding protein
MADKKIIIDTSVLIEYFRKTDKNKTTLVQLSLEFNHIYISSITEFEIFNGATPNQIQFWIELISKLTVLDFDSQAARVAATVVYNLKKKRKSIDKPDLFIASTALVHKMSLATLNKKDFEVIDSLIVI